jgi:hypothetical protein
VYAAQESEYRGVGWGEGTWVFECFVRLEEQNEIWNCGRGRSVIDICAFGLAVARIRSRVVERTGRGVQWSLRISRLCPCFCEDERV